MLDRMFPYFYNFIINDIRKSDYNGFVKLNV